MQLHRGIGGQQRLLLSHGPLRKIRWIADDRMTEMPEVQSNLMRATRDRLGLKQRGAVGVPLEDGEFSAGGLAGSIQRPGPEVLRIVFDGSGGYKKVFGGMPVNKSSVKFLHLPTNELRLQQRGHMAGLRQQHKTAGIRIQSMHRMRFARMIDLREPVLERVAVESSAGMHRQRGGFVEHDQGIVFVEEGHVRADGGLDKFWEKLMKPFPGPHPLIGTRGSIFKIAQLSGLK